MNIFKSIYNCIKSIFKWIFRRKEKSSILKETLNVTSNETFTNNTEISITTQYKGEEIEKEQLDTTYVPNNTISIADDIEDFYTIESKSNDEPKYIPSPQMEKEKTKIEQALDKLATF